MHGQRWNVVESRTGGNSSRYTSQKARLFRDVIFKQYPGNILTIRCSFFLKSFCQKIILNLREIDEFLREIETTATEYILTWFNLISLTSYIRRRRKNILIVGEISYFVRIRRTCKTLPVDQHIWWEFYMGKMKAAKHILDLFCREGTVAQCLLVRVSRRRRVEIGNW